MNEEYQGVPRARKVSVLVIACLVFMGAVLAIIGAVLGWFTPDENNQAVGTISNAPSVSAPAVSPSVTETPGASEGASEQTQAPSPSYQATDEVLSSITSTLVDGVNSFESTDNYSSVAGQYFYSYKDHLGPLYAAGLFGEMSVQNVEMNPKSGLVTVEFSINDFGQQALTGYWSETAHQFKIVSVSLTPELNERLVPSVIESVKYL